MSTKLAVLGHLVDKVDHLIIGGGMANTFLAARGVDVGKSLCEQDLAGEAEASSTRADAAGCTVHLPYDVVVATDSRPIRRACAPAMSMKSRADEMILDIGPAAVEALADALKTCRTLVWNGPLGAFETPPFDAATVALAQDRGGADRGWHAGLGRRRRRHRRGAQPCRRRATISPSSRPPAARSSSGWKAASCPASQRLRRPSKLANSVSGSERSPEIFLERKLLVEGRSPPQPLIIAEQWNNYKVTRNTELH